MRSGNRLAVLRMTAAHQLGGIRVRRKNQTKNRKTRTLTVSAVALCAASLVGCGQQSVTYTAPGASQTAAGTATDSGRSAKGSGSASVAYAGSLQLVNDRFVGPAFTKATGMSYQGRGGGSFGVAQLIAGKQITPNVFESIGAAPIKIVKPAFTNWAIGFASSPLVVAYSSQSPFAAQLKAIAEGKKPLLDLFALLENPAFHLGRTNPQTDPQGQAFIFMLRLAAQRFHLPAGTAAKILGSINNPNQIFAEEAILSRLQAGQLDAASAFLPEAIQRHLPYIALPSAINLGDPADAKAYGTQRLTLKNGKVAKGVPLEIYVTTIKGTPSQEAGIAFVKFLLSSTGEGIYAREGYTITKPVFWGKKASVPTAILSTLGP